MPKLLDLFCGAGGAAMGYHRAGFEVVGVDIVKQKHYPFDFVKADALSFPLQNFDAIHASPPCQMYSCTWSIGSIDRSEIIARLRKRLQEAHVPYVIENVFGAPLIRPTILCGNTLNLRVYRHRLFETSFHIDKLPHKKHLIPQVPLGRRPYPNREFHQPVGNFSDVRYARIAMDIPWMTRDELKEAIPPAYTEYVGKFLLAKLSNNA